MHQSANEHTCKINENIKAIKNKNLDTTNQRSFQACGYRDEQ